MIPKSALFRHAASVARYIWLAALWQLHSPYASLVTKWALEPRFFHMQSYYLSIRIRNSDIRHLYFCQRFQSINCFRYISLGRVRNFLPDDFPFIGHTEQNRAARSVKKCAKCFHGALQLSGGLLELHLAAFCIGCQSFYYIKIVYGDILIH